MRSLSAAACDGGGDQYAEVSTHLGHKTIINMKLKDTGKSFGLFLTGS